MHLIGKPGGSGNIIEELRCNVANHVAPKLDGLYGVGNLHSLVNESK